MLHNMILNGKNANIDELMLQLEVENALENRYYVLVTRHVANQVSELDIETTLQRGQVYEIIQCNAIQQYLRNHKSQVHKH
jgi:hypothetical protein